MWARTSTFCCVLLCESMIYVWGVVVYYLPFAEYNNNTCSFSSFCYLLCGSLLLVFYLCANNRPGMLASISERISSKGLSIENVVTELRMGKGGRRNFCVNVDCTSTSLADKENLHTLVQDLSTLKTELGLDILDIRVHTE